ncbi:MAG: AraC family transcriptional regulator [Victivallaceae bacterium]|nr:AraC family transcriptional regulator [Victivallaceae bacterium]
MTYFDGIDFVTFGDCPDHDWMIRGKRFTDYYGIQYNHAGTLRLAFDGGEAETFHGAHLFFTMPGRVYDYGCIAPEKRHHVWVCFKGPRVGRFIAGGLFDPAAAHPVFPVAEPEKFYEMMLALQKLLRTPGDDRRAAAVHLLETLLLQVNAQAAQTPRIHVLHEEKMLRLRDRIAAAPQEKWDFDRTARQMSLSLPHFRRLFQEINAFPPNRFLIECRMKLAESLLSGTALSVREIAGRCGYDDAFYFTRLFKRRRGRSPLDFRKEFQL